MGGVPTEALSHRILPPEEPVSVHLMDNPVSVYSPENSIGRVLFSPLAVILWGTMRHYFIPSAI